MTVKRKLQAQRGATITAALLFFLVAAVCGSIILAAATATASRVKNQAKDAQAFYAVTSAARLIRDDLMDSKWKLTLTETYGDDGTPTVVVSGLTVDPTDTFVRDLVASTFADNKLVIDSEIQITSDDLPTVYAKADANKLKYNKAEESLKLNITLTNYGGDNKFDPASYKERDDNGNQLYWVSVELCSMRVPEMDNIVSDDRDATGKGTVKREIGLTWDDPIIRKVER